MSHKVHQKIYRIKEISDWFSRGFYNKKMKNYLEEDFKIRTLLKEKLPKESIEEIEIERTGGLLKVIIKTSRPALVIGRGGEGVERLRKLLEKKVNTGAKNLKIDNRIEIEKSRRIFDKEIKIEIQEIRNPWVSAQLVAQWIVAQIEKRTPFRRALKMALSKMRFQKEIQGAKVEIAGRLNGVEIARTEWLKEGKLPRHNLRAVIDYGTAVAFCTYGAVGVKVWIYKGEKI